MADSRHTTKPSVAPEEGVLHSTNGDPVVGIAHQIQRLWDAHHGAEVEQFDARQKHSSSRVITIGERCAQIRQWLDALETIGTYTVASSMPGAMIQIAWAMSDLESLAGNLENSEAEKSDPNLSDYIDRIQRLMKSVADVMVADLGEDYEPVRKIVETYAHLGDRDPNWLHMVDNWAEQGILDFAKLKAEVAA